MSEDPEGKKQEPGPVAEVKRWSKEDVEFIPAPDVPSYFTNVARVHVSSEDACLIFGQRNPQAPNEVREVARVFMTLSHLKRFAAVLAGQVMGYEALLGPIDPDPAAKLVQEDAEGGKASFSADEFPVSASEAIRRKFLEPDPKQEDE
jgi:hypothetical protein